MPLYISCPCTSNLSYEYCCQPYHDKILKTPDPESLMRSRYSAYALHLIDYLIDTTHPSVRKLHARRDIEKWAKSNQWLRLEICNAQHDQVEFKAYYKADSKLFCHHENSTFKKEKEMWYYVTGIFFNS